MRLCSGSITNKKFGTSITPDVITTPYCEGISVSVTNLSAVYIRMISLIALIKKSQYGAKWKDEELTENYRKYQLSLSEQIHWSVLTPQLTSVFQNQHILNFRFLKSLLARWERHTATLLAVFFLHVGHNPIKSDIQTLSHFDVLTAENDVIYVGSWQGLHVRHNPIKSDIQTLSHFDVMMAENTFWLFNKVRFLTMKCFALLYLHHFLLPLAPFEA